MQNTINKWIQRRLVKTRGSHPLSFIVRPLLEKKRLKAYLGAQLAGITALYGVVAAPLHAFDYSLARPQYVDGALFSPVTTETTYQMPLVEYKDISQYFGRIHPGVDIRAPRGTNVQPIAEGIVIEAVSQKFGYGQHVRILHEGEVVTLYAHLDKTMVKAGQTVTKETVIGTIGMTGWTTGPHLHFEMSQSGKYINPLNVIAAKAI